MRPEVRFARKSAHILLDQIRAVDKSCLAGKMGEIDLAKWHPVLLEMLA
jgi:mRNA interferase MazF